MTFFKKKAIGPRYHLSSETAIVPNDAAVQSSEFEFRSVSPSLFIYHLPSEIFFLTTSNLQAIKSHIAKLSLKPRWHSWCINNSLVTFVFRLHHYHSSFNRLFYECLDFRILVFRCFPSLRCISERFLTSVFRLWPTLYKSKIKK